MNGGLLLLSTTERPRRQRHPEAGRNAYGPIKAQAKRIDDHVLAYPVAAGPQGPNVGGGAGGGGGGAPPPPQPPPAGGLVLALLSPEQSSAMTRISRPDLQQLLKTADVPVSDGETIDSVRNKCAAATWAAGQLRRPSDVRSLPGSLPAMVTAAFSIPDGWVQEAQDQALSTILEMCRQSSWALDPTSSLGLVSPAKSAIFRAAEAVAFPARQSLFAQVGTHLSTQETSMVESMLALSGHSVSDLIFSDGKWVVRSTVGSSSGQASSAAHIPGTSLQPRWRIRFAHCMSSHTRFSLQTSARTKQIEAKQRRAKRDKLLFPATSRQRSQTASSTLSQSGLGNSLCHSESPTLIPFLVA